MEYGYERDLDDHPEFFNYGRQNKQHRFDQILSNLHSLFKERATDNDVDSNSVDDYDDLINNKKNEEDKHQFDEVLTEVTSALDKIKKELIKFNNDGVLTVEAVKQGRRYKRETTNDTVTNSTITENNATVADTNSTTTEKPVAVTDKVPAKNATVKSDTVHANNDTSDTVINSRRMIPMTANAPVLIAAPEYVASTSRVKDKLLSYLEDTFDEVERKIKPLTNIKIALSNDDHYRIGYIIATIDTLEVNLKKLKSDMNLHQHNWDEQKILDLFDRIKATNTVTTSLIESLKKYLPRN